MNTTVERMNISDNRPHTPGPWRANGYQIEGPQMALVVAVAVSVGAQGGGRLGWAPRSENEARGNARLIAAAPALLAALEALCADKYLSDPINAERMAEARAAIARARA